MVTLPAVLRRSRHWRILRLPSSRESGSAARRPVWPPPLSCHWPRPGGRSKPTRRSSAGSRCRPRKRRAGAPAATSTRARHRGHIWPDDFLFDATERGLPLKLQVALDEYAREGHRSRVGRALDSAAAIDTRAALFKQHGPPKYLRSDNGGEFIAARQRVALGDVAPGRSISRRATRGRMGTPRASTGSCGTSA